MAANTTLPGNEPQWNSQPQFQWQEWAEPLIVAGILLASMYGTRRKGFRVFPHSKSGYHNSILDDVDPSSSDELLSYDADSDDDTLDLFVASNRSPKRRWCCGVVFYTPNTSRFTDNVHSRVLQKFPFLIEMIYWIMTYLFYRLTKVVSQAVFAAIGIWDISQEHGIAILRFEHNSPFRFLFPLSEYSVQHWFMQNHHTALTFLNRAYALVHIPGTVGFIAWYYYVAPNHSIFATVRRTLTLTNWLAFVTFSFFPCMPPRLLPKEYGFLDSVRHANAESIWMSGKYVNSLAAMPSMHFGYAFCIGCTFLYHSGVFRRTLQKGETEKSAMWKLTYVLLAIGYPLLVLTAIVATANHYWLDAVMAVVVSCLAYTFNRIFLVMLPLEDILMYTLRCNKPIPSTGEKSRRIVGKL